MWLMLCVELNATDQKVEVTIHNFEEVENKPLEAVVIRCTIDRGEYIVGCRMLEDNQNILEYVEKNM